MVTKEYCPLFGEHKSYPCSCGYGHWKFEKYEHHGRERWVRKDMKGKNKDFCLCYSCENFKPNTQDNCEIAASLYAFIIRNDAMAVIWDCAKFVEKR